MRESIGGTWIFSLVIIFIVLFSGYLAVSVNYSKAFKVKNGIVAIIEENEGLNSDAQEEISTYLNGMGYYVYGTCQRSNEASEDEKGYEPKDAQSGKYKYCIKITKPEGNNQVIPKAYYTVKVFFRLDLPILGDLFTFPISGETKAVYFANDTN